MPSTLTATQPAQPAVGPRILEHVRQLCAEGLCDAFGAFVPFLPLRERAFNPSIQDADFLGGLRNYFQFKSDSLLVLNVVPPPSLLPSGTRCTTSAKTATTACKESRIWWSLPGALRSCTCFSSRNRTSRRPILAFTSSPRPVHAMLPARRGTSMALSSPPGKSIFGSPGRLVLRRRPRCARGCVPLHQYRTPAGCRFYVGGILIILMPACAARSEHTTALNQAG